MPDSASWVSGATTAMVPGPFGSPAPPARGLAGGRCEHMARLALGRGCAHLDVGAVSATIGDHARAGGVRLGARHGARALVSHGTPEPRSHAASRARSEPSRASAYP